MACGEAAYQVPNIKLSNIRDFAETNFSLCVPSGLENQLHPKNLELIAISCRNRHIQTDRQNGQMDSTITQKVVMGKLIFEF